MTGAGIVVRWDFAFVAPEPVGRQCWTTQKWVKTIEGMGVSTVDSFVCIFHYYQSDSSIASKMIAIRIANSHYVGMYQ